MEIERDLRDSILLYIFCIDQTWTWKRVCAVEISYLRGACGVARWEGESNESVYERRGMEISANGVCCSITVEMIL